VQDNIGSADWVLFGTSIHPSDLVISQQTGLSWDQAIEQQPENVQAILASSWQ